MLRSGWARFQTPYSTEATGLAKRGLVLSLDLPPRHRTRVRAGPADSHSREGHLSWVVPVVRSACGSKSSMVSPRPNCQRFCPNGTFPFLTCIHVHVRINAWVQPTTPT
jgi:hypothetical protein